MRVVTMGVAVAATCVTACCGGPKLLVPNNKDQLKTASDVVNKVKDELNYFMWYFGEHKNELRVAATGNTACKTKEFPDLEPHEAKLDLKLVAVQENEPSVAIGPATGIKLNAAYSGAYSRGSTQEVAFTFPLKKVEYDKPADGEKPENHPLALAAFEAVRQMTLVDHAKQPCFVGTDVGVTLNFEVKNSSTGGIDLSILIVKVGDKHTVTSDATQSLTFTFTLPGGYIMER